MTAVLPLYALADEYELLGQRILEAKGVLTPELSEEWDKLAEAIEQKVENTGLYIKNLLVTAKAEAEEAEMFSRRAKTKERAAKALKEYLKVNMERVGKDKLETLRVKARIQINPRPAINWTRPVEELPDAFKRIKVEVDVAMAHEAWKLGQKLPEGFEVFRGTHLRLS
jgi:hypothetical protein